MVYRSVRIRVVFRVILILLVSSFSAYIILRTDYWSIILWILPVLIIQIIELIRYLEKTQRELNDFLRSVKSNDFSNHYQEKNLSTSERRLKETYNDLTGIYRKLKEEKEFHSSFLKALIEHVNISIVCFDNEWKVQFINKGIKKMLNKKQFFDLADFERLNPQISNAIKNVSPDNSILLKFIHNNQLLTLTVRSSEFILFNTEYRLVSFQNISPEMEKQELDSWKKLIRTITHEVNNSAIPITNLSTYVSDRIITDETNLADLSALGDDEKHDLLKSIHTITNRSEGLVRFVNSTRSFTKTLKPFFSEVRADELFEGIYLLLKPELKKHNIAIDISVKPEDLIIRCDNELFEQLILNLLLNSIDALENIKDANISVEAYTEETETIIKILDNGKGIEAENLQSIFVPYFTTKENGSGIGLSLCRNIIEHHKGKISVQSEPGKETIFKITL